MDGVGKKIKQLRIEKKLTLQELGDKINFNYSNLSKIERGERKPTIELVEQLASFFDVPMSYFFGESMEIPIELDKQGIKWMKFIGEMKERNLSPEEIISIVDELERIKKLF